MYRRCCRSDKVGQAQEWREEADTNTIMAGAGGRQLIFRQMYEHLSSTYTYLLACGRSGEALLIDPVIETVERDLSAVEKIGCRLKYAVNTHCHADHVTGTGQIRARQAHVKTAISRASGAKADWLFDAGDTIAVGDLELEVRPTPGHTDGCVAFVWHNGGMVFTGDALLINGCGRTDFQQGNASVLYDSVHKEIFSLPDHYLVYPAHDYKGLTCSSVGEEKRHNPRLTKSREDFIKIMDNLNLAYPKQIDKSLPANLVCGVFDLMDDKTRGKVHEDLHKAKIN